jgi:hypothetical protein
MSYYSVKKGDYVKRINCTTSFVTKGEVYYVVENSPKSSDTVYYTDDNGQKTGGIKKDFKPASTVFKIGDFVKCINDVDHKDLTLGRIYKVLEVDKRWVTIKDDAGDRYPYSKKDFKPVSPPVKKSKDSTMKFTKDDLVECIDASCDYGIFRYGGIYSVIEYSPERPDYQLQLLDDANENWWVRVDNFEKVSNQPKEENSMNIDMKTLLIMQMMNNNTDGQNPFGSMLPLLLLGDGEKLKLDRAMLLNAIPDLSENERQSISEGNTEAALTSVLARQMAESDNALGGLLPLLLLGDD